MALWSRLTGLIGGGAIASAAAAAVEPVLEPERQKAWLASQSRILNLGALARLVAQGILDMEHALPEAQRNGFTEHRLEAAVQLELVAAPVSELLALWRRGKIPEHLVDHGLAKAQIEHAYWPALKELEFDRLDPAVVAVAVQRGIMPNAHDPSIGGPLLPVGPPSARGLVPPMPMVHLDPFKEAKASGDNPQRLAVRTRIVGLPPAAGELLQLLNRGKIHEADYFRGIAEGNTRNEWAKFLMELRRRILTPHEYAELRLRGWIDDKHMHAGAALDGMIPSDTDLLHKLIGRPIPVHQVTTGEARGGHYNGPSGHIPNAFLRSLEEGNLRPEWYNLAYANRFSLPSPFVTRSIAQSGDITEKRTHELLLWMGWPPDLAKEVSHAWHTGGGTSTDKHVTKAETSLWTRLHKGYVDYDVSDTAARATLHELGVSAKAQPEVLRLWQSERKIADRTLTAKEITKMVTLKKWTRQQAITRLVALGYTVADANTLLAET